MPGIKGGGLTPGKPGILACPPSLTNQALSREMRNLDSQPSSSLSSRVSQTRGPTSPMRALKQ